MASRRYQLSRMDWRSLRGIPFEQFLADVFRSLGYNVQTTRASGDQGADLLVMGKGRRIAVQAKGYDGAVGNKAIQEVHLSKSLYRCESSVAITNSSFTKLAREAAQAVDCLLIDGTRITELIEGRIR
jgi:restriction system protein